MFSFFLQIQKEPEISEPLPGTLDKVLVTKMINFVNVLFYDFKFFIKNENDVLLYVCISENISINYFIYVICEVVLYIIPTCFE